MSSLNPLDHSALSLGRDARGLARARGHRSAGLARAPVAAMTCAVLLALLIGLCACDASVRTGSITTATPKERAATAATAPTQTRIAAKAGTLRFGTGGTLWRTAGDSAYTASAEEDVFAWSTEVVKGPFEFSADVESNWDNYGEAMVVVYGDGEGWSSGCLIFNVTGYWQGIRAHSIYDPETAWVAQNEQRLPAGDSYLMTVQVTDDEARLYVNEALVLAAPLQAEHSREGYIGLVKYAGSAPVTFRNIVFHDQGQTVAGRASDSEVAQAVSPTDTARPTRTPAPTRTSPPTYTPRPPATQTSVPSPTSTPSPSHTPAPTNTPVPPFRPPTGMLVDKAPGGMGELLIKNGTDSDALVILTGLDEQAVKTAYIHAAESFNMTGIHDGTYLLFFSKGDAFSEETYRFTQNATYQRMDTTIPFETTASQYTVWELTLYGVAGGTVGSERVDPEDFP
jgi:hypothetical protein